MKKTKEYVESIRLAVNDHADQDFDEDGIARIIIEAQKDAIKDTLKLVSERALVVRTAEEIMLDDLACARLFRIVDKNSILSLKDELFKTVDNE